MKPSVIIVDSIIITAKHNFLCNFCSVFHKILSSSFCNYFYDSEMSTSSFSPLFLIWNFRHHHIGESFVDVMVVIVQLWVMKFSMIFNRI